MEAKGVFIRAPEGQPVRAIAGGQVVYAEWMRGFGNLLILDHGEAYLSIYANNESLLKQVGDVVAGGEAVATTGASGGNEETGLYFEMRHLGRAFDPLRWVKPK
jgi:murein hydrolase activator